MSLFSSAKKKQILSSLAFKISIFEITMWDGSCESPDQEYFQTLFVDSSGGLCSRRKPGTWMP